MRLATFCDNIKIQTLLAFHLQSAHYNSIEITHKCNFDFNHSKNAKARHMADMAIGTRNEELAAPTNDSGDSAGDSTLFVVEAAFGEVAPASLVAGL